MSELRTSFGKYQENACTFQNAVYHTLKEAIFEQSLGDEVTEGQIASELNISRTPVREAMHKLSVEGLLEISHGRKAKVRRITRQDIDDIAVVLKGLHRTAMELCIANATAEDFLQLEEIFALMELYTNRSDPDQTTQHNTRFHLKICELSRNRWLYDITTNLLNYTYVYRKHAVSRPGRIERALAEHRQIIEVLRSRDLDEARRVISEHVSSAFSDSFRSPAQLLT